jgi:hypothetical protein
MLAKEGEGGGSLITPPPTTNDRKIQGVYNLLKTSPGIEILFNEVLLHFTLSVVGQEDRGEKGSKAQCYKIFLLHVAALPLLCVLFSE